jgi:hypothetical protein
MKFMNVRKKLECLSLADFFLPSLMFPGKPRAYPSEATIMLHSCVGTCLSYKH